MGVRSAWGLLVLVGVIAAACSGSDATTRTTPAPNSTTSSPVTTTSPAPCAPSTTALPPSQTSRYVPVEPDGRTRVQLLDAATLEPAAPLVEVPGYLSVEQYAVLPDGRLMLLTWEGQSWSKGRLTLYDIDRASMETVSSPLSTEVRVLGYSPAFEGVLLIDWVGRPRLILFDPVSLTFDTERFHDLFEPVATEWFPEVFMFDGGRKLALYSVPEYNSTRIGEPPTARVADLENCRLGEPIAVEGVVHGLVDLPSEAVRYPEWPYGEVSPGIAFDDSDGRLFVAHADGKGLAVVDLFAETVEVASLVRQPSFWERALWWLIPPAEAKGSEPSATLSAWLSPDRSLLLITGVATDAWRDSTRRLHASTTPLGLTVIDTETLDVVASLDLPVSHGLSTSEAVVLAGTTSSAVYCDQECNPSNNEPEIDGEPQHSGLYVLDPASLEIRFHHRPGANFYPVDAYEDWLVAESFGADGNFYDAVDLRTGRLAARIGFSDSIFMVTNRGVFIVEFIFDPPR